MYFREGKMTVKGKGKVVLSSCDNRAVVSSYKAKRILRTKGNGRVR